MLYADEKLLDQGWGNQDIFTHVKSKIFFRKAASAAQRRSSGEMDLISYDKAIRVDLISKHGQISRLIDLLQTNPALIIGRGDAMHRPAGAHGWDLRGAISQGRRMASPLPK